MDMLAHVGAAAPSGQRPFGSAARGPQRFLFAGRLPGGGLSSRAALVALRPGIPWLIATDSRLSMRIHGPGPNSVATIAKHVSNGGILPQTHVPLNNSMAYPP